MWFFHYLCVLFIVLLFPPLHYGYQLPVLTVVSGPLEAFLSPNFLFMLCWSSWNCVKYASEANSETKISVKVIRSVRRGKLEDNGEITSGRQRSKARVRLKHSLWGTQARVTLAQSCGEFGRQHRSKDLKEFGSLFKQAKCVPAPQEQLSNKETHLLDFENISA